MHLLAVPERLPEQSRNSRRRTRFRAVVALRLTLLGTLAATTVACRDAATSFGPNRAAAATNADAFWGALAARFTNVQRSPKVTAARTKLGRYALSPSGVYRDTAVWTAAPGTVRSLTYYGALQGNRYRFDASASAPTPRRPGDSWHFLSLRQLGSGEYEWNTAVDMAVGPVAPDDLLGAWRGLLATAARTSEPMLRAEYRTFFPRSTAALGQLATLDSLRTRRLSDGSAVISLHSTLHPQQLRQRYPHYARFLEKYVSPARYSFTLEDRRGARWLITSARANRLHFQLRSTADGRLAPLDGVPRPVPDTLLLKGEAHAKFSIFNIGASSIVGEMAIIGSSRERGWHFRFREEPDWHFPLAVNNLIRSALRRPFAGDGTQIRLTAARRGEGQTIIGRRVTMGVQEAAIVRWLGNLGFGALSDFSGQAEEDENRFNAALFVALQEDFAAILGTASQAAGGAAPR